MGMSIEEHRALFKATLSMFSLDAQNSKALKAEHIQNLFDQVLKAYASSKKNFEKQDKETPSNYVPLKTIDV